VTESVIGSITPKLVGAEIERAKRKPTDSLDAYDYYLRGEASSRPWTREANAEALRLYCKAIELDPNFAAAYGRAAFCYVQRKARGWLTNRDQEIAEGARLANRAVRLARDDAEALCWGGYALAYLVHDLEGGAAFIDQALAHNPNDHAAWALGGWVKAWLGEPEAAIEQLTHAMRLSPLDPLTFVMQAAIGFAHFLAGRYDDGSLWAGRALRQRPDFLLALVPAAANNAFAGHLNAAQRATEALRSLNPSVRISNVQDLIPLRRPEDLAKLAEALRKAGLPE
jgi:tetratricopeptide (TPR) repeat protein